MNISIVCVKLYAGDISIYIHIYTYICILSLEDICRHEESKNGLQGKGKERISVLEYNLHFIHVNSSLHFDMKVS